MKLQNYACGDWVVGQAKAIPVLNAVNGEVVAESSAAGLDYKAMLAYARRIGGPNLRKMTFHERALMLKALAKYLMERKEELYQLSWATGATKGDSWIDIEGGIGTFFVYASKGRRDFPNDTVYVDGLQEAISKGGSFTARHICVPLEGAAVHINAFNFPCWGMLEKLATSFLAGMPAIVKPATVSSFLAEKLVHLMIESGLLPIGALQLICGGVGDLFDHLTGQDIVTFTGSAETGRKLKSHPAILNNAVRFNMEADSLNCSILGPDAEPGTPEFDLFIKEVAREMTVKAGQKCTAIRRTIVPDKIVADVIKALQTRLSQVALGDPQTEGVRMGPLAAEGQRTDVRSRVEELLKDTELTYGNLNDFEVKAADKKKGAFFPAILLYCKEPLKVNRPHDIEAFGPVSTVMAYKSIDEAIELAKKGKGSLCASVFTADDKIAREIVIGAGAYHGRMVLLNKNSAPESTGHGSPLPHLVHGGPGRAGGGEEMGGLRGVLHYMQRVALQGSPTTLTAVTHEWHKGGERITDRIHPFRKYFEELQIGETLVTHRRTITESDIVNFAGISGDFFYAHMDDIAAKTSIFERRVAHGYFVIAAAAGLFVDPAPGPVLANYGLESLRFTKPVYIGDTIYVKLACKRKTKKETPPDGIPQGVVEWDVEVLNQADELCATYSILTLVRRQDG